MNRFEKLNYLLKKTCSSPFIQNCEFLDEMVSWMSEEQFKEFFEHVCSCWDIPDPEDKMNEFTVENDEMIPA